MIRLGIDASNLRAGGGVTHLRELLTAADPVAHGITQVTVWAGGATLAQLPQGRSWLALRHERALDGPLPLRLGWQQRSLGRAAAECCDVLFVPGGLCLTRFRPFITMSRNMLPFENSERRRYGMSLMRAKLTLLRAGQTSTLRRADGVVFLTEYARQTILAYTGRLRGATAVVPHGVNAAFRRTPKPVAAVSKGDRGRPCRLLYVSIVDAYKHQWHVAEAVARLRDDGWPVEIDFVGGSYPPALRRLRQIIARRDPTGAFLRYRGMVPYQALPDVVPAPPTCSSSPRVARTCRTSSSRPWPRD